MALAEPFDSGRRKRARHRTREQLLAQLIREELLHSFVYRKDELKQIDIRAKDEPAVFFEAMQQLAFNLESSAARVRTLANSYVVQKLGESGE